MSRKATWKEPHLQPLSRDHARNWFYVAEKQFGSAQIDDQHDKFSPGSTGLDQATTVKVMDVIEILPMQDRYNIFRGVLIDRFAVSSWQKIRRLLLSCEGRQLLTI